MDAHGVPRSSRPCQACGRPVPVPRLRTEELAPRGWKPGHPGTLPSWCGHLQVVEPWQEPDGYWTLIPLVGTAASMSELTIGTPEEEELTAWTAAPETARLVAADPGLLAEKERLEVDLNALEALGDPATCRVCAGPELTKEHAPSQASGNTGRIFGAKIDPVATRAFGMVIWGMKEITGGSAVETLCGPCNNGTGRRYNPAYLAFEAACRPQARPETAGTLCSVTVAQRPLVAKQVLTWVLATSQPGLAAKYPHLSNLVKRTSSRGSIAPLRLWCHLVANRPGITWYSGIVPKLMTERRQGHFVASFTSSPLGWLLTFDNAPVEGALEVSDWLTLDKRAKPVTIELPCQWRLTGYPEDFRSAEQIRSEGAARIAAMQQ